MSRIIISNANKNKPSTKSAVALPVATPFSTYATSRRATMKDAQLRLPIKKERATPAQSPSPTAPNTAHISEGAQQRTILLPTTLNSIKSTTERRTSVVTYSKYRMTPTQALSSTQQLRSMITQGAIATKSNSEIPVEPPDLPIPPKPPDPQDATTHSNNKATLEDKSKTPHGQIRLGPSSKLNDWK